MDIATPNGAALQAAIGAGNVRAWAASGRPGGDQQLGSQTPRQPGGLTGRWGCLGQQRYLAQMANAPTLPPGAACTVQPPVLAVLVNGGIGGRGMSVTTSGPPV